MHRCCHRLLLGVNCSQGVLGWDSDAKGKAILPQKKVNPAGLFPPDDLLAPSLAAVCVSPPPRAHSGAQWTLPEGDFVMRKMLSSHPAYKRSSGPGLRHSNSSRHCRLPLDIQLPFSSLVTAPQI